MVIRLKDEYDAQVPCIGKRCEECVSCRYDQDDLYMNTAITNNGSGTCNECKYLAKVYFPNALQFSAACSMQKVMLNGYSVSKPIVDKTGPMLSITTPSWCPIGGCCKAENSSSKSEAKAPIVTNTAKNTIGYTHMTYAERKEAISKIDPRVSWEDINIGDTYVVPNYLGYLRCKLIKVVSKTDCSIEYREVDKDGNATSSAIAFIFKVDETRHFLTKYLKF